MIKPSPGRVCLFHVVSVMSGFAASPGQRVPALVCQVNDDRNVNVVVFDAIGQRWPMQNVALMQPEDNSEPNGNYCHWMPFQVGQAPASESLEARVRVLEIMLSQPPQETKVYTDGTSATGPGPLPDLSPAQQDAASATDSVAPTEQP